MRCQFFFTIIAFDLLLSPFEAKAQNIEPEGLYINSIGNSEEAVIIRKTEADSNLYSVANFIGVGGVVVISADGQISIEGIGTVGVFDSSDSAQLIIPGNPQISFDLQRVIMTDSNFLDFDGQAFPVNPVYEDSWSIQETLFNPRNGNLIRAPVFFDTVFSMQFAGDGTQRLRSTQSFNGQAGNFFQGFMRSHREYIVQAGEPVINNELALQTLPDNFLMPLQANLVSMGRFIDINTFMNIQFLESRMDTNAIPFNQGRIISQQILTRDNPLLPGDFNTNGSIDDQDRDSIIDLYGLSDQDIDYNLLGDIDNNGVIDLRDSAAVDGNSTVLASINNGFSGSWFNTGRSGEGWNIAILPGGQRAIVAFFTFSPDGSSQTWVVGAGDIINNEIVFNDLNLTGGTVFGEGFDPEDVVRNRWGDMRLYFTDCNNGVISYSSDDEFGHTARNIQRLTNLAGVDCQQSMNPTAQASQVTTGSWFAPERDGEGFVLEALTDNRVVLYWYTYDVEGGQQYWLGGVGVFNPELNSVQFDALNSSIGPQFGDAFTTEDLVRIPWGSATFQQMGCNTATFNFDSEVAGFGSSTFNLIRLTSHNGIGCNAEQFTP